MARLELELVEYPVNKRIWPLSNSVRDAEVAGSNPVSPTCFSFLAPFVQGRLQSGLRRSILGAVEADVATRSFVSLSAVEYSNRA